MATSGDSPPVAAWTSDIDGVTHGVATGTVAADVGRSVAIGDDGSIYLAGAILSDTVTIGSIAVNRVGTRDGFVARLSSTGDPIWFKSIGVSGQSNYLYDVEVLDDDTIVIAGLFTGTLTIGSETITSAGDWDGFVAALDTDGNGLWATRMGGTAYDEVTDTTITTAGTIAVVGMVEGSITVDTATLSSPWNDSDDPDGVVFILDSDGDVVPNSPSRLGSSGSDELRNVAEGNDGNLLVTGSVSPSGTAPTGDPNEVSGTQGGTDAILASLDSSGDLVWSQIIGGTGNDVGDGVVVDSNGRVTIAAQGRAPFTVAGASYTGGDANRDDIILSQFDADGSPRWTDVIDGGTNANDDGVRHLTLGPENQLVSAGLLTPPGASKYRFMVMVHDADGDVIWGPVNLGDDANRHIAQSVAVTPSGDLLATGRFQGGPVDPDDPSVTLATSSSTSDIVLIRLAGVFQASAPAAPRVPGQVPPWPEAVVNGDRTVTVSWAEPFQDGAGPITGYRAVSIPSGASCVTSPFDAELFSCVMSDLEPGIDYLFEVLASNSAGEGPGRMTQQTIRILPQIPDTTVQAPATTVPDTPTEVLLPATGRSGGRLALPLLIVAGGLVVTLSARRRAP